MSLLLRRALLAFRRVTSRLARDLNCTTMLVLSGMRVGTRWYVTCLSCSVMGSWIASPIFARRSATFSPSSSTTPLISRFELREYCSMWTTRFSSSSFLFFTEAHLFWRLLFSYLLEPSLTVEQKHRHKVHELLLYYLAENVVFNAYFYLLSQKWISRVYLIHITPQVPLACGRLLSNGPTVFLLLDNVDKCELCFRIWWFGEVLSA